MTAISSATTATLYTSICSYYQILLFFFIYTFWNNYYYLHSELSINYFGVVAGRTATNLQVAEW